MVRQRDCLQRGAVLEGCHSYHKKSIGKIDGTFFIDIIVCMENNVFVKCATYLFLFRAGVRVADTMFQSPNAPSLGRN